MIAAIAIGAGPATAEPIGGGVTVLRSRALQDILLLPNTPFNPTGTAIPLMIHGDGTLTLYREDQSGDTIVLSGVEGLYYGSHALLGDFVFGSVPPLGPSDFGGMITDVVQDPSDPGFSGGLPSSFASGVMTISGPTFGFTFLSGPAAGLTLFTDPADDFRFTAMLDGLPPSPGTTLTNAGDDVLGILFNGMLVAESSNRRIVVTAVPEPSTIALCGAAGVVLACWRWRARRASR